MMAFFKERLYRSQSLGRLRTIYSVGNFLGPKTSQESLYCASLPDEKIEEGIEMESGLLRKTASMNDIDRFHRYYDHINTRFEKMGAHYPWDKYIMSVLELTSDSSLPNSFQNLSLDQPYTEHEVFEMEICTPKAYVKRDNPSIKTQVHWITPAKTNYSNKFKPGVSISTPKCGVHWVTPNKRDMTPAGSVKDSLKECSTPGRVKVKTPGSDKDNLEGWPTPGTVKDMIKYWSTPELSAKLPSTKVLKNLSTPTLPKLNFSVKRQIIF